MAVEDCAGWSEFFSINTQPSTPIDHDPAVPVLVWMNGEMRPAAEPVLAADNPGWLVGLGVFETLLGREGEPCLVDRHLRRLADGAARLGIDVQASEDALVEALRRVMAENALSHGLARLRLTVVPGTILVTATAFIAYPETVAVLTSPFVRNERGALTGIKSTSYADNILALQEAKRRAAGEAIMANTRGELCEGATSNIFLVRDDDAVITPPLRSGCLPGVMREVVIERCRENGIVVQEEDCPMEALSYCREAFLTSSLRGVQAIDRVDDRALLAPGKVTGRVKGLC